MKKFLIIITLLGVLILGFGLSSMVQTQQLFLGMYWIAGAVSDPDGVGTDGRRVVFYKEDPSADPSKGYADELVGVSGLSGRDNQYILNAFEDWRLEVAPGKYYVAIVKAADGYGANPVEATLTGQGYDIVDQSLVLAAGAGIAEPPEKPTMIEGLSPEFEEIRFGKRLYQRELVAKGQEFIISDQPEINAKLASAFGVSLSHISMVLNEGTADAKTFKISASHIKSSSGPSALPTAVQFSFDFNVEDETLVDGEHELSFQASNAFGTTVETCTVTVAGGEGRLLGVPITFPSPLHLQTTGSVTFQYTLSRDMDIEMVLLDVSGRIVKRFQIARRDEGGSAGVNKVSWNLSTEQGSMVSSGIYIFTIINRENNKLLGKGKFTCLP